jgi:gluconokinase
MCKQPQTLIIMGAAGAGKSTVGRLLAERLGWCFIEGDDFHSPENIAKMSAGVPLTDSDRKPWLDALNTVLREQSTTQNGLVLACSALKLTYRKRLAAGVKSALFVYLKADPATLTERLTGRQDHYMPAGLLMSQLEDLEEPDDAIMIDATLPAEQIVRIIVAEIQDRLGQA